MKNFIVEVYSNTLSLEEALNKMSNKYFPIKISDTLRSFTVIYCKKDLIAVKQMKNIKC